MNNYDADYGRPQYEQNSREWQLAVLNAVEHKLNEYLSDIEKAGLTPTAVLYFGSFLRGETKANGLSDFDVFILIKDPPSSIRQGSSPTIQSLANNVEYDLMDQFNLSHIAFQATTHERAVSLLRDLDETVEENPQILEKAPGWIYTILKTGTTVRGELPDDITWLIHSIDQSLAQHETNMQSKKSSRILSRLRSVFSKNN